MVGVQAGGVPDPEQAADLAGFIERLEQLRVWGGDPSFRALAKRVGPLLRPPQEVSKSTVADMFASGRRRLNLDLVVAVVRALGLDEQAVDRWRAACVRVHAQAKTAGPAGVLRQLPADLATFTGREAEVARLLEIATASGNSGPRTVLISAIEGMAGIGKTQLAVHVGHELLRRGRFADAQLYVNLRGFDAELPPVEPGDVLERFLTALGVPRAQIPATVEERAAMLRDQLFDKEALVLLDNAADENQIRELIPSGPRCLVLVTSRRTLAGLDGATSHRLDVFNRAEAVELLARIAGSERIEAEPEAVDRLIAVCGFLPLAVAVAAARLRARPNWTVADLLSRLEAGGLEAFNVGGRSVRPLFDLSYQGLAPELRQLFGLLGSLFKNTVTVPVAAAVAGVGAAEAEELLDRLADEHLLQNLGPGRYTMHDLIRAYAAERVEDVPTEQRTAALARLTVWYIRSVEAANAVTATESLRPTPPDEVLVPVPAAMRFDRHATALAWLTTERANLVEAVLQAEAAGLDREASTLALLMTEFLGSNQGYWEEYAAVEEARVRAECRSGSEGDQAEARNSLSRAYMELGRFTEALETAHLAAAYYQRVGWTRMQASSTESIALAHLLKGDHEEALPWMRDAVTLRRADPGNAWGLAATLNNQAELFSRLGRAEEAFAYHEEAIAITHAGEMKLGAAMLTASYGDSLIELRLHERAITVLRDAADRFAALGDPRSEARTLGSLATAYENTGDGGQAAACRERATLLLADG